MCFQQLQTKVICTTASSFILHCVDLWLLKNNLNLETISVQGAYSLNSDSKRNKVVKSKVSNEKMLLRKHLNKVQVVALSRYYKNELYT